jgi:putative flippase GtrA
VRVPAKVQSVLDHPLARHPLVRRITGYSAGSVIALIVSEAAFAASYGWGHVGTTGASAFGFVGGAVPNYILNRRWVWSDRRGRDRRTEFTLYMCVSIASFLVSAVATHWAEVGTRQLTTDAGWRVLLVTGSYLGVSAAFFVFKFFLYEKIVFTKHPDDETSVPESWRVEVVPSPVAGIVEIDGRRYAID